MSKKCSKCQMVKRLDCFHKDRSSKDGYNHKCKECTKVYGKTDTHKAGNKLYSIRRSKLRKQIKLEAVEYLGGCCSKCGFNIYIYLL